MTTHNDEIADLEASGVTVAWVHHMQWRALWLPDERLVVLNAQESRESLAREVSEFLGEETPHT